MLQIRRRLREFQVGTLKRKDSDEVGLIVFDPLGQEGLKKGQDINLFEVAEKTIGVFRVSTVKRLLGSPDGFERSEIELAVDEYCHIAGIDPEVEWLEAQRKEAGLLLHVNSYAALQERYCGGTISYEELLSTPEWLEKRATILARDNWTCLSCSAGKAPDGNRFVLNVHHKYYVRGWLPWDYPDDVFATLCRDCHQELHDKEMVPVYDMINGKLVRITIRRCIRCLGAGFLPQYGHVEGGICFRCRGAGFEGSIFDVASGQSRDVSSY